ncbi:MAG: adenylyl-sulfate kinase [Myxococcales bacterium]|nr:adenylyl-sulfate kinase [Myxococcota bacterium]MDW8280549.1 adenylyl-sulfate kinase [Myxococcales bacterium]
MAPAFAVWITGRPGAGKSTLAQALARALRRRGVGVAVLESDALRALLAPGAGYDEQGRATFYRALLGLAALLVHQGVPVLLDATANRRAYRADAATVLPRFLEVLVDCPQAVCEARDPKGLYRRARAGEAPWLPGVGVPYEPPEQPDVVVQGATEDPDEAAGRILAVLSSRGYMPSQCRLCAARRSSAPVGPGPSAWRASSPCPRPRMSRR